MRTIRELPWNDKYDWDIFRKASTDIKEIFEFNKNSTGQDRNNIDTFLWRHWIVAYSIRHAIEFVEDNSFNFVECGVADGVTAFFALREIQAQKKVGAKYFMHLYDSWKEMNQEGLTQNELPRAAKFANLNLDRTKRNLAEFKDHIIYHQGYIPEIFNALPPSPNSIIYLHVDLNAAKYTLDTLEYFFPRLMRGGVILFDDYGDTSYKDTKEVIDKFFSTKPGVLMKLPTGQAIYYR